MNTWKLTYNHFNPEDENLREALCTLGNGYFGTRGAVCETAASKVHYPGTYVAGVYNSLPTEIAGRTIYNEDLVNCPNWLIVNCRIGKDPWFNRLKVRILSWQAELNMKKGILSRRIRWQDQKGRITLLEDHRIVSMAHPHCGALRYSIIPENYDSEITIRTGLDGSVINAGVERYKKLSSKHLEPVELGSFGKDGIFIQVQTSQSKIQITEASRTLVYRAHKRMRVKMNVVTQGKQAIGQEFKIKAKRGEKYLVEKLVSIYTSRDPGVHDDLIMAQNTVSQIESFDDLYQAHQAKWQALWSKFDVEVKGDDFVQLALRLHTFHLLQVASPYNEEVDAGLPARGLHGEAYRGHIFWDEMYVFPYYTLHAPEITRALLMYRYRRLTAAKENASQHGFRGAMFPWQSASTGEETTQIIHLNPMSGTWGPDFSSNQRHVSIAIAYNIWNYYTCSGDRDFLNHYGAEMLLEIALFWSSITELNKKTRRYEIHGVMGPDEYHEKYPGAKEGGIKNNAYTNVMAVWVIERAVHILENMCADEERIALMAKTGIGSEDIKRFKHIMKKMYVPMDDDGIIHQFQGYMELEELDWKLYQKKYDNIRRMDRILKAEGLSADSYKVAKQADTLMLMYILSLKELKDIFERLGYPFDKQMMKKNYDYYFKRTSHGSTLSMVVHSYISDMLGYKSQSMNYFVQTLESDLYDVQGGTTQEGIHAGVMGGSLDMCLRCFAGLTVTEERISLKPKLPQQWKSIKFNVRFKSIWFNIVITDAKVKVMAELVEESLVPMITDIPIEVNRKKYMLKPKKQMIIITKRVKK